MDGVARDLRGGMPQELISARADYSQSICKQVATAQGRSPNPAAGDHPKQLVLRLRTMIELTAGDLVKADAEALVNTVNCDGFMGRGIAAQFKRSFPANFGAYKQACKRGEVLPRGSTLARRASPAMLGRRRMAP